MYIFHGYRRAAVWGKIALALKSDATNVVERPQVFAMVSKSNAMYMSINARTLTTLRREEDVFHNSGAKEFRLRRPRKDG